MKFPTIVLTTLQISALVTAHPFVIISTRVQGLVLPTHLNNKRQGFLDDLTSAVGDLFGTGDEEATSTVGPAATRSSAVTLPPPVTASATVSDEEPARPTSTNEDDPEEEDPSTRPSDEDESTTTEQSSRTSASNSNSRTALSSSPSSTSSATAAASAQGTASPATTSSTSASKESDDDDDQGGMPAGGVALAVIMVLLILSVTGFLVFRYHPKCQVWWAARQEKARIERSYREGIDGAGLSASPSLRQQALGDGASRRRTMIQSFLGPATARFSMKSEVKRKPVKYGAPITPKDVSTPTSSHMDESYSEKISMTASAAPLGQIERYSLFPAPPPPPPAESKPMPMPPIGTTTSMPVELPSPVPPVAAISPSPRKSQASSTVSRSDTLRSELAAHLPAHQPVSPMTLPVDSRRTSVENLNPISPMSTLRHANRPIIQELPASTAVPATSSPRNANATGVGANTNSSTSTSTAPVLPPPPALTALPSLSHAKRGSDGVFRLS